MIADCRPPARGCQRLSNQRDVRARQPHRRRRRRTPGAAALESAPGRAVAARRFPASRGSATRPAGLRGAAATIAAATGTDRRCRRTRSTGADVEAARSTAPAPERRSSVPRGFTRERTLRPAKPARYVQLVILAGFWVLTKGCGCIRFAAAPRGREAVRLDAAAGGGRAGSGPPVKASVRGPASSSAAAAGAPVDAGGEPGVREPHGRASSTATGGPPPLPRRRRRGSPPHGGKRERRSPCHRPQRAQALRDTRGFVHPNAR